MRVLYARPDHERDRSHPRGRGRRRSGAGARRHERKSLPVCCLSRNHRGGAGGSKGRWCGKPKESRMKTFDYVRPATVREAVAAASEPGAAYLAAGTNLLDLMKGGIAQPSRLVDVSRLKDLDRIEELPDGSLSIGAMVGNADLAYEADFARAYPAISEALLSGASAQLRNAATVGGNLMQRTRCGYFYDTASRCNKRESGSGCDAKGGDNRLHAILGFSEGCIATHASDFCVPLVAFDAVAEIEGKNGHREVAVEALHRLPGTAPERDTELEPGELIVAVRIPAAARGFAS